MRPRRSVFCSDRLPIGLLVLATPAFCIAIRHDRPDSRALELGDRYPAVCSIKPMNCTGTLVAPKWVLTAGHVAASLKPETGKVRFGEKDYSVARVVLHPEAKVERGKAPDVDVALVELVDAVEGIEPLPLYRDRGELGRYIVLVGYGEFGDGRSALHARDGNRRGATNIVIKVEPRYLFMKFDEPPGCTDMEGASGVGDSGGPSFMFEGEVQKIVGIGSSVIGSKPGKYGDIDVHMRVSEYAAWIDKTIAGSP